MSYIDRKYNLRLSDFDSDRRLRISSILDLFQDIAAIHSEMIGTGFDEVKKLGVSWVIMRTKLKIHKLPKMYTNVTVRTWPHKPSRSCFIRDSEIYDEDGNLLIEGSSIWTIIDNETRKQCDPDLINYTLDSYYDHSTLSGETIKRIRDFNTDAIEPLCSVSPLMSDLDFNGHVNNTKYVKYAFDALQQKSEPKVNEFQIDYHKELRLGDNINVYCQQSDGICVFKGVDQEGKACFFIKTKE
ncbi:MAG: thioesterase [Clostridia bacterium]|nr:thioesterase [Clostridia bacterium]